MYLYLYNKIKRDLYTGGGDFDQLQHPQAYIYILFIDFLDQPFKFNMCLLFDA